MPDTSIVERVAAAIFAEFCAEELIDSTWAEVCIANEADIYPTASRWHRLALAEARAAIAAIRESLEHLPRYDTPVYDDIGMQERPDGDWIKLSDIDAALSTGSGIERGRSAQYRDGYRRASKDCVEWLHGEAKRMNDPHAMRVLNSAAFHLGRRMKIDAALTPSEEK